MHTTVRLAQPADADSLAMLESDARAALVEQRGGPQLLREQPEVGEWSPLLARDDRVVFVATIDDLVFGYLELAFLGDAAVVRQVFVHPGARELGFGDEMLGQALDVAREQGCRVLEGTALPGDRETKNLYERAGITARKITVSTPLAR